ncbi:MAG: efflux RND transporter permease subunit [Deferribacteres bacterium]|nr:efflux RND transporter permease subunit [Deferribacteres bacterium]
MIQFSLKRPVTVLMITVGLCLLGHLSWQRLPVQLLPELIYPEVYVGAGLPGGSPEEVERQLVLPVEAEIATLEGVKDIESTVNAEFFSTKIVFDHDVDMQFAILKLQQKMTALEPRLPQNTRVQINRFDTSDLSSFLMQLSLRGDRELTELRDLAERKVRPRLEQVDGVVNLSVGGGSQSNIGVIIDPDRCEALGIPVTRVQQKIDAFHRQPEHLGQVLTAGLVLDVNLIGRIDDLSELQNLVIDPRGIRLQDVALVGYSEAEKTRLFRVNGKAGVGIFVQKDNTSNMLKVADDVLAEIELLNETLKRDDVELVVSFSQAELIATAIDRVKSLAVTGAVLALIVLFLFLRNMRFVTILMIAIPVSLLVTANFMYAWDLSVNIVSLCGLALAIGMLVDNGIVVMENIFTHYQQGKSVREATLTGTKEVSRSIFAATGTTVLVFLPVLFIESDAQLFVRELALSVIFPLCVSFVVALTVVPLLASRTLSGKAFRHFGSGRVVEVYRLLLKSAVRHRVRTVSTVVILLLLTILIGTAFILTQTPPPPPDRLDVYVTMPQGATLERADQFVRQLEDQVLALPDVEEVRANIQIDQAQVSVTFLNADEREQSIELDKHKNSLRRQNETQDEFEISFEPPSSTGRGGGRQNSGGGGLLSSEKGLRLRGNDINTLRQLSEQIQQTLRAIEDIEPRSVHSELRSGAPEVRINGDRLRLAMWGLTMQQVMTSIWGTRAEGSQAATPYFNAGNEYDIQMLLRDIEERQLADLEQTRVMNSAGQVIPIKEVADIRLDEGPGNIVRYNQERQAKITYALTSEAESVKARVEAVEAQIDLLLQEFRLPRGFTLERLEEEDQTSIYYWMLAIAGLLIFMFLAAQFESLFSPFVIIGTIPTAIIGALLALTLTGTPLSLGEGAPMALLGLIVLLGIVVNNGIILLDRIAILRNEYGYRWQRAVMAAAQNRVRPILMTSATTILGIFPLALKQGTEFEIWPPFAITVLGGLTVSALSTLVFIPVLYVGLEQTRQWLKGIGWPGLIAGSLVAGGFIYWYYQNYHSLLYTSLLTLPVWFGVLGLIFAVQQLFAVRKARAAVLEETLHIRISNLTKIYGSPGRFTREWQKQGRREELLTQESGLPWSKTEVQESTIWVAVVGLLLLYLHTFIENGFWLVMLTLATIAWFFAAREQYYRWRFVLGKPPKPRQKRSFRFWRPKKQKAAPDSVPTEAVIQDESIVPTQPDDASTHGNSQRK